jgi:hypothetical protein
MLQLLQLVQLEPMSSQTQLNLLKKRLLPQYDSKMSLQMVLLCRKTIRIPLTLLL